ncbi:hypothetical protein Dvina_15225 [Dactylosporangium vinaceum]|uniref:Lipoprotein n=1 Tax=Dactylosporangium vinaceum TaxID=53362 RepID=A0ABV5M1Z2_9ACTN|nr:hypothetical protein [Dactylosporangium vinaceum]UAB99305.1 hypothetical protein Dvina_15225 [Dactylosporangium vinaceum]
MRTLTLCVAAAMLLALAACSSPTSTPTVAAPVTTAAASAAPGLTTTAPATAAPTTAAAAGAGKLTLDLVKQQVGPVFAKDPDCPRGAWVTDPGNIDAKYRANVTAFGEYDCHLTDGETIPHRVAQAVFLTFKDQHSLNDYADAELGMVPTLVDGATVVIIGSGLKTVEVRPMLRAIENACGCGHVA